MYRDEGQKKVHLRGGDDLVFSSPDEQHGSRVSGEKQRAAY